ncbi:hypothetical protein CPB85DRAFT_1288597 [Mucidula mucida]|nr:hypothetical protein CPB85DRAFT_1288597 [Mucidula mucida]
MSSKSLPYTSPLASMVPAWVSPSAPLDSDSPLEWIVPTLFLAARIAFASHLRLRKRRRSWLMIRVTRRKVFALGLIGAQLVARRCLVRLIMGFVILDELDVFTC